MVCRSLSEGKTDVPSNKALHLTPVNVAKIRVYSHSYRVVEHIQAWSGAGELDRSAAAVPLRAI